MYTHTYLCAYTYVYVCGVKSSWYRKRLNSEFWANFLFSTCISGQTKADNERRLEQEAAAAAAWPHLFGFFFVCCTFFLIYIRNFFSHPRFQASFFFLFLSFFMFLLFFLSQKRGSTTIFIANQPGRDIDNSTIFVTLFLFFSSRYNTNNKRLKKEK